MMNCKYAQPTTQLMISLSMRHIQVKQLMGECDNTRFRGIDGSLSLNS